VDAVKAVPEPSKVGFSSRDDDSPEAAKVDETTRRKLKSRQATGFVKLSAAELELEDDDDDEDGKQVKFDGGLEDEGQPKPGKKKRVLTAFVRAPPDGEENEDEGGERGVKFNSEEGAGEARVGQKKRVPTAFVRRPTDDEVEEDEEEQEDEEEAEEEFVCNNLHTVRIKSKEGLGEMRGSGKMRVPTAFPRGVPEEDEDEDDLAVTNPHKFWEMTRQALRDKLADLSSSTDTGPRSAQLQLLQALTDETDSLAFCAPVSTKLVPGYRKFIKRPMDLRTLADRVSVSFYGADNKSFLEDLALIWRNCYLFNGTNAPLSCGARRLSAKADELAKTLSLT